MLRLYQVKTYIAVFVIAALQASLGGPNVLADDKGMDFQVKVVEGLSVDISTPSTWAMGDSGSFITNKINISVTSNNAAGYHVSMTSKDADPTLTNVLNSSSILPTLTGSWTRSSSGVNNFWGYSTDDVTYNPVVGFGETPTRLLDSNSSGSGSRDVYFGAKTDLTKEAGTYTGKVLISVVTGTIGTDNPITPSNPAEPVDENNEPYYDESGAGQPSDSTGVTAYTTRTNTPVSNVPPSSNSGSTENNTRTHTEINDGDVRSLYESPQGEVVTSGNSLLPTMLVATSVVAAASGIVFFALAKSRDDDDEEEEA